MEYTVSTASMVVFTINILLGILVPVLLFLWVKKKFRTKIYVFFIGAAVMFLFALILEQIMHGIILGSPAGSYILEHMSLYALYGGLMAGLFEEGGRFLAFRTVLKKERENNGTALMYGAGHGGFECFYLLVVTGVNNLIYSVLLNTGNGALLTAGLPEEVRQNMDRVFFELSHTAPAVFLISPLERGAALILQLSLSVLVWFAAKGAGRDERNLLTLKKRGKNMLLFPLAIFIHFFVDAAAVILSQKLPILAVELVIWLLSLGCAVLAAHIWKHNRPDAIEKPSGWQSSQTVNLPQER